MVVTGLEQLLAAPQRWLHGARVGLVAHAASVDSQLRHAVDLCRAHPAIDLRAVFGPQHGFTTHTQDNMIEWEGGRDPRLGLPVYSLYGEHRRPTAAMLDGLDCLLVDLQDVGTRVYTYIWTMAHCLEAAAELGLPVVVLDRPNPLGGEVVEGPNLDPAYRSFIGLYSLPLRHGLTIGEVAQWVNTVGGVGADLTVVPCLGWQRRDWFESTGLPWVLPSPNMPTMETAVVYPGAVLLEGTTLSEGRGTCRPFEICGAPGLDPQALCQDPELLALPGLKLRPLTFAPTFQKHAEALCGGVQLHVTDRATFAPVLATALLLTAAARQPGVWDWLQPPYEYVWDRQPIDILAGSPDFREGVAAGRDAAAWRAAWAPAEAAFREARQAVLRYS
ncbi:MAG: DUF1343 domain-containing protein [Fimbriimonadaceae bacterium]|nr:DUF1343 domain-containing protein [Fimbriimonadaceae bacterium]